jgi:hypothetical protein
MEYRCSVGRYPEHDVPFEWISGEKALEMTETDSNTGMTTASFPLSGRQSQNQEIGLECSDALPDGGVVGATTRVRGLMIGDRPMGWTRQLASSLGSEACCRW